jgi:hypothetical protein
MQPDESEEAKKVAAPKGTATLVLGKPARHRNHRNDMRGLTFNERATI